MIFFRPLLKLGFISVLLALAAARPCAARTQLLMGTALTIEATGGAEDAVDLAFKRVSGIEAWMSTYRKDSEVSRLNARAGEGPVRVSEELWNLLTDSRRIWSASQGAFDPTYSSPAEARGYGRLRFDAETRTVELPRGAKLDFGGIGKGWALDRAARVLREGGVLSARLDFGGQLLFLAPPSGRKNRLVEIPDPRCRRAPFSSSRPLSCRIAAELLVAAGSVATTGNVERPGHVVDPKSGRALNMPRSITVVAGNATLADAWSTALFVSGPESLPEHSPICALEAGRDSVHWHGECENYRNRRTRRQS
jgi:thiamine biosynthesis lipoprotein